MVKRGLSPPPNNDYYRLFVVVFFITTKEKQKQPKSHNDLHTYTIFMPHFYRISFWRGDLVVHFHIVNVLRNLYFDMHSIYFLGCVFFFSFLSLFTSSSYAQANER